MADAPPFNPTQPFEAMSSAPPFDPSKPFETVGPPHGTEMDDSARQWAKEITAPRPDHSGDTYGDTLSQYYDAAAGKMREGFKTLYETSDPTVGTGPWVDKDKERGLGATLAKPFKTAGALADIGMGALQGTWAPATAAVRMLSNQEEKYVGIPAEQFEAALLAGAPGKKTTIPIRDFPVKPEWPGRTVPPAGEGSLSTFRRTAAEEPPPAEPPVPGSGAPIEPLVSETPPGAPPEPVAPVAPAATSREGLDVRLMPHDVPHVAPEGGYRSSVGAAGSPTDVLANYSPQTITVAKEILADSGLNNPHMLEQALEGTSQHHTFAELSLPMQEEAARLYAASGRGEGAKNTISQTYLGRAEEEPQRIGAALDRGLGSPQNLADLTKTTELERAKASDPLYKSFRNTVVRPTQEIRDLMTTPTMQKAMKYANGALADERLPSSQGFARTVTDADGNWIEDIEHTPTAQAFQYAKEYIDGLIERTMAQPGGGSEARRYTLLKNQLVNALDNHPDPNVAGVWKAARQAYAEPSELLDAQKFGRKLLTNNVDREDLPHLTEGWSDAQMERARIGLRGYLESLARSNRSPARVSNKLLDAVLSPGNQEKIRWAIGDDQKADELISAIEHEESMHGAPGRIIGGSPSANRLLNNRYVPAPSGLENISLHDLTHPKGAIAKGLAKVGLDRMAQKRTVESAKLRDELSRMFTTQGAERNAVARALIGADEPPVAGWSSPAPVAPSAAKVAASVEAPVPSFSPANPGGWRPVTAEQIAAANRPVVPPAAIETAAPEAKGLSALEFLASKGGLKATPELLGIMGKNKFLGSHGWVFRTGGLSEDKARELLAEAGYIRNEGRGGAENRGGGTSTIRDFHEVVNDEARGRKRYAVGEDGAGKVDPDEARHRFESDVMDHFAQEGAPVPDGKMRDRVVELVRDEGMSPLAAHEQAVMEEHYAGQDEGTTGRTGAVPVEPRSTPAGRATVKPGAREPEGAGTGEAPFLPRAGNPEAPGSAAEISRLKTESTARMADRLGVTDRVKTMASAGRTDEEISNALAGKLKPDEVATLREHLGLSPAGSLLAPGEADFDIPFPLKRNVLQRDASGRPMRTAPIPIGTEEKILQAGFDRSRGLGLPQFARGGAVLSMRTRTESHYSPTRGKPNHHCGEDKDWQTGWCKHFRKPHSCSEVAGHIATKGGCDWYEWVGYPQERADGGRLVCGGDIPEHQSEAQWRSDPPQGGAGRNRPLVEANPATQSVAPL